MNRLSHYALALAAAFVLGACSSAPKSSPIVNNAPDWVNKGSGAFKDASGAQVFYGVGIVSGVRSVSLAVPAADDKGRVELAKIMNSLAEGLSKNYAASVGAGDKVSEEQMISQTSKVFAKFTLHGAMPVDHCVDRSDKDHPVYYALVKLDMAAVQSGLAQSQELDSKVRDYVKANAEKAFDELNAEEAKH